MYDRKRRKTSELWNFFKPIDSVFATCNLCKMKLSFKTSTSNLKKHLQSKHPTVKVSRWINFPLVRDSLNIVSVTQQASETVFDNDESQISPSTSAQQNSSPRDPEMEFSFNHLAQECISSPLFIKKPRMNVDCKLLQLFTKDFHPFSIVEDSGFKEFVDALNPAYQLPTRNTISETLIPTLYEQCVENARDIIKTGKKFCITTECWTSITTINYVTITAHFLDENFKLNSILLECLSAVTHHTPESLEGEIRRILSDWKIRENDVILAVSDSTPSIKNAIEDELRWHHFACFAHTINSIVKDGLNNHQINKLISKMKEIIYYYDRNRTPNDQLLECQSNLKKITFKLRQDENSTWNSSFYMLQRFVDLEKEIKATLASIEEELPKLTSGEWKLIHELYQILRPFEDVTKSISDESYCTASLVVPLVNGLNKVCLHLAKKQLSSSAKIILANLQFGLKKRFNAIEENETLLLTTFLDPKFKAMAFSNKAASEKAQSFVTTAVIDTFSPELDEIKTEHETDLENDGDELSIWNSFDTVAKPKKTPTLRAVMEVQRYLEDDLISRSENSLRWWQHHKHVYPHLAKVACEFLCALASSVPCEKLFSKERLILTERRNSLSDENTKMLLFLNYNMNVIDE